MNMLNNLYLIISEDKQTIDFNLNQILKKIDYDEMNKITYDLSINPFTDLMDEASMISLFSNTKVIIANNFNQDNLNDSDIEYLTNFINSKNKDIYLIIVTKKIDSRKKNYRIFKENFNIIDTQKEIPDLKKYINNLIIEKGYKIDNYNLEYLQTKLGNDPNNINNELEKLFTYKQEDKTINKEDIDLLILDTIDTVIYEFTNAILDNDLNKTKKMYDKFTIDNIQIDYLISTIATSIRTNLIIKLLNHKNMTNQEIGSIIGKKEYFVKKSLERLYQYSIKDLEKYLLNLSQIDLDIKSGKDNVGKFELFLFSKNSL